MKKPSYIYIRFTSQNTLASWLVTTWTNQWPSHIEMVIAPGVYIGSDIETGVTIISDDYYKNNVFTQEEYFKIPVTEDEQLTILTTIFSQIGKDYDTWALIGNVCKRNWQNTNKWFCSELIAWACLHGNKQLINKKTNRITPGDILSSNIIIPCNKQDLRFYNQK